MLHRLYISPVGDVPAAIALAGIVSPPLAVVAPAALPAPSLQTVPHAVEITLGQSPAASGAAPHRAAFSTLNSRSSS